jgi:hypothetical protein
VLELDKTTLELEASVSLLDETTSTLEEDRSADSATNEALISTSKLGISKEQLPSTALPPIPHIPGFIAEPGSTATQGTIVLESRERFTLTEATL